VPSDPSVVLRGVTPARSPLRKNPRWSPPVSIVHLGRLIRYVLAWLNPGSPRRGGTVTVLNGCFAPQHTGDQADKAKGDTSALVATTCARPLPPPTRRADTYGSTINHTPNGSTPVVSSTRSNRLEILVAVAAGAAARQGAVAVLAGEGPRSGARRGIRGGVRDMPRCAPREASGSWSSCAVCF
jgi:hypothetical protein